MVTIGARYIVVYDTSASFDLTPDKSVVSRRGRYDSVSFFIPKSKEDVNEIAVDILYIFVSENSSLSATRILINYAVEFLIIVRFYNPGKRFVGFEKGGGRKGFANSCVFVYASP